MNDNKTYYQRKKNCKKKPANVTVKKKVKKKQNTITKTTKEDCKNKRKVNIENYLTKKKI